MIFKLKLIIYFDVPIYNPKMSIKSGKNYVDVIIIIL